MLMATRQVARRLIDVSKEEINNYKETLATVDTVTESQTLEDYIKLKEEKSKTCESYFT